MGFYILEQGFAIFLSAKSFYLKYICEIFYKYFNTLTTPLHVHTSVMLVIGYEVKETIFNLFLSFILIE